MTISPCTIRYSTNLSYTVLFVHHTTTVCGPNPAILKTVYGDEKIISEHFDFSSVCVVFNNNTECVWPFQCTNYNIIGTNKSVT